MRIRSIKPEFWTSEDVTDLTYFERLLFIGLWSYADDHGRGQDRESLIVAALFPEDLSRDPRDTVANVSRGLSKLSERGLIVRYSDRDGRRYLAVTNWTKHQRVDKAKASKYPAPTSEDVTIQEASRECRDNLANVRDNLAPGTGSREQGAGSNGAGNILAHRPVSESVPDRFDEFWSLVPRKVGKDKARTKFAAAVRRAGDPQIIIDGMRRFASDPNLPEKKFIPHPATWLEAGRWDDEPLPPRLSTNQGSNRTFGTHPDDWDFGTTPDTNVIDGEVLQWPQIEA